MIPDRRNLLKRSAVTAGAASFLPVPAARPSASADRALLCRGLPMLGGAPPDCRSLESST